jgi:heme-degrading monooxygenase HmoA
MQTIAQQLNIKKFPFQIRDTHGKQIYLEDSNGYWIRREWDSRGKIIRWEDSNNFWEKMEWDSGGNRIYFENSNGRIIDNRPNQVDK